MSLTQKEMEVSDGNKDSPLIEIKPELIKDFPNRETVDKMHFKAVARQKFDAVLKHEINNRRTSIESNCNPRASGGPSQCFRIENSKIFSIKAVPPKIGEFIESTTFGPKVVINNSVNSHVESSKSHLNSKSQRDTEGQVFIYDPILVSADSLTYVGTEKNMVNSASNKQEYFMDDKCFETNGDTYSDTVFRCFLCPYFHVKEMMIARHWIQSHLSHNVYICPYCQNSFLTNHLAMKHIMDNHGNEPVEIEIKKSNQFAVKLSFDQKNSTALQKLDKPLLEVKDKGNITNVSVKCHKCGLECKSIANLEDHHRHVHIHFRPYSCGMCNSRICFATKIDLDHHIKITHPNVIRDNNVQVQDNSKSEEVDVHIDWSQTCSVSDKGKMIKCKWCEFQTSFTKEICQHALRIHHWSKYINCPKCNASQEMKDEHYRKGRVTCLSCAISININHDMNGNNALVSTTTMYKCVPCDYKTASKGSICRHLKYTHSKCRPFCCPYCPYAAVERPKVRSHILSLHPGMATQPTEKLERSAAFKKSFDDLFRRYVKTEKVEFFKNAFSGELKIRGQKNQNVYNRGTSFECGACKFTSENVKDANDHIRSCHQVDALKLELKEQSSSVLFAVKLEVKEQNSSVIFGEHFKCISCNYKCLDRSCMARHVKYKHLTSRPHQCPHCPYNNVEKTKVRLHIGSNHPLLHNHVTTNQHLLEQMSLEAKKFYIRVDANGKEYTYMSSGNLAETNEQKAAMNNSEVLSEKVRIIEANEIENVKVNNESIHTSDVTPTQGQDNAAVLSTDIIDNEESIDNLSDLAQSFSGSIEEDEYIDLNDNSTLSTDEDMLSIDLSQEESSKNKIPEICIDNLIVEPYILEDPKISKKVPIVCLKDFVIIDEVDNLVKAA